jgi:hypothetical protein
LRLAGWLFFEAAFEALYFCKKREKKEFLPKLFFSADEFDVKTHLTIYFAIVSYFCV